MSTNDKIDSALDSGDAPIIRILDAVRDGERLESIKVGDSVVTLPDLPSETDFLEVFDYLYTVVSDNGNIDWMFLLTGEEQLESVDMKQLAGSLSKFLRNRYSVRIPKFILDQIITRYATN